MSLNFKAKQMGIYHTSTPVFNKRVFKAQAGIVLTEEVLKILNRPTGQERSKTDLHKLKSVVNGLKDVHKDFQFIKDALSIVIGYEKVEANIEVKKQSTEKGMSCYYILTGSIEATYDINDSDFDEERKLVSTEFATLRGESANNKTSQNDSYIISYTHVAGDYLGLVSGDGPEYDLPPPKSIKTLEVSEFLRIDRGKFHHAVRVVHNQYVQEVEHFINSESILRHLPEKERQKLVPLMAKQVKYFSLCDNWLIDFKYWLHSDYFTNHFRVLYNLVINSMNLKSQFPAGCKFMLLPLCSNHIIVVVQFCSMFSTI